MKLNDFGVLLIMTVIAICAFYLIPYAFPDMSNGKQVILIVLSIGLTWGCIGIWYNRKG